MRFFQAFCFILFFSIFPFVVNANEISKEAVKSIGKYVHSLLPKARISDGSYIGEERAKDLIYPLIPYENIKMTIAQGQLSGFAEYCALDWQNGSYKPYMSYMRHTYQDWTDYQFAYVGLIHGYVFGVTEVAMQDQGQGCTNELKVRVERGLVKKEVP